jgi:heme/copper-type cytochrome/quinol oxidase subunit 2
MKNKGSVLWESLALLLVIIALAHIAVPLLDDVFMKTDGAEIVIRLSIEESGGFDPEVIRVKKGQHVKLVLISMDVAHGFAIEALSLDAGVVKPEEKVVVEFVAEQEGAYMFKCTHQCSPLHHYMRGTLIVEG